MNVCRCSLRLFEFFCGTMDEGASLVQVLSYFGQIHLPWYTLKWFCSHPSPTFISWLQRNEISVDRLVLSGAEENRMLFGNAQRLLPDIPELFTQLIWFNQRLIHCYVRNRRRVPHFCANVLQNLALTLRPKREIIVCETSIPFLYT